MSGLVYHEGYDRRSCLRQVLIPCMSGLVYHELELAARASDYVLIPCMSGLVYHFWVREDDDGRTRLNPLYVGSRLPPTG